MRNSKRGVRNFLPLALAVTQTECLLHTSEAMLSIGCKQALKCHTGCCPTGIATLNKWLMSKLDQMSKSARLANYVVTLRKEMLQLSRACGVSHPALLSTDHFEMLDERFGAVSATERFGYEGD